MKIVLLTNGSKHGLEIIRQLKNDAIYIECIILEKKMLKKRELKLLYSKLGKASFVISLIPFKNMLYRLFRKIKYDDTSAKKLKNFYRNVFQVSNLTGKECETILKSLKPDIILLGGSRIIKENILKIPKIGTLNAHPGILPNYRGLDVIQWALYNGDVPGVTIHFVNSGIDTGPICIQEKLVIEKNSSIDSIKNKAIKVSAHLMSKTVSNIIEFGEIDTLSNDPSNGKYYKIMPKEIYNELLKKLSPNEN